MTVDFEGGDGPMWTMRFTDIPEGHDRAWFRFVAEDEEKVYGGGEQFTYLNLRGRSYPIWTREQGGTLDQQNFLRKYELICTINFTCNWILLHKCGVTCTIYFTLLITIDQKLVDNQHNLL